jgi:hypothetical protein
MKPEKSKINLFLFRAVFLCGLTLLLFQTALAQTQTRIWTNTAGGNWNVAANWSPNQVPSAANTVIITNSGNYTVTLNVDATVTSLTLGSSSMGAQTLQTSGFSLDATNTVVNRGGMLSLTNSTFYGTLTIFNGGVLDSDGTYLSGAVTVETGAQLLLTESESIVGDPESANNTNCWLWVQNGGAVISTNGAGLLVYAVITNSGVFNLTNCIVDIYNSDAAVDNGGLYNLAGGVINLSTNADLSGGGGYDYMVNEGTINVTGGTSAIAVGSAALTGTYNAASGSIVEFYDDSETGSTLGAGLVLAGAGQYQFISGLLTLPTNTNPVLQYTGGTLVLGPQFQGGAITNLGLDGIDFSNALPITGMLAATNGILTGSFVISNGGNFILNQAYVFGQVTVASGGVLSLNGYGGTIGQPNSSNNTNFWLWVQNGGMVNSPTGSGLYLYTVATNSGVLNLTNSSIEINNTGSILYYGGLYNLPAGVINLYNDTDIDGNYGYDYMVNEGTINIVNGTGSSLLSLSAFTNAATLRVESGEFALEGASVSLEPSETLSFTLNNATSYGKLDYLYTNTLNLSQAGTLQVTLNGGYVPAASNTFQLFYYPTSTIGTFSSTDLPSTATWQTIYGAGNFAIEALTGAQTTPVLTWNTPAAISYGTPLSSTQLDASANVPGSFAYNPASGTVLNVGTNALTVVFTPTDTNDYTSATDTVSLVVVASSSSTYNSLLLNTPNLLGYWPFTQASQANSVVNGYTGTFQGDATIGPPGSGPALGSSSTNTAVILDGNNSYVNTSLVGGLSSSGSNADQGSIIGWFYLTNLPSIAGHYFTIAGESQEENDFDLQIDTDNEIHFYTDSGSSTVDTNALTAADFGVWHFVAATFTSAASRNLYLDGVLVASSVPGSHNAGGTGTFAMGESDVFTGRYFEGALADVAVFNRQLSSTEVSNLYAAAETSTNGLLITFDDLSEDEGEITNGYSGLNWNNFDVLSAANDVDLTGTGYETGTVSNPNVAYNGSGDPAYISSGTPFVLISGYFTAAWNNDLTLEVIGAYGSTTEYDQTYTLNVSGPLFITFPDVAVTSVEFESSGGTAAGVGDGSGTQFALDNLAINGGGSTPPPPSTTLINFDTEEAITDLTGYLEQFGVTLTNDSPGTEVVAENETNIAGGDSVVASSQPNLLTQTGSSGPVGFTAGFSHLLTQFSFTRPELLPGTNSFVTHPAWEVQAFDPLGDVLDTIQEPQISSSTNVPAQSYTLTGGSIASVQFGSEGTGLTTFNAMLLDDFILTPGTPNNLPPSVVITGPTNGEIVTSAPISINADTAPGSGTVSSVTFYSGETEIGSAHASPFSITWDPPSGTYSLTAVAINSSSLSSTSAPVVVTVALGFSFETQPVSQTVGLGEGANFSASTTGTGVSYQWQLNGTNIAGATSASYSLTDTPLGAAGNYTVIATGDGQSITSAPALLTVLAPPTLGSFLVQTNGNNIILSLSASDIVPFYYQWELNGTHIPGASNSYAAGMTTITYIITNAQPYDSGDYQVVVANSVASANSPVFPVAVGFGTNTVSTNVNFGSSLAIDPLGSNSVTGVSSLAPPTSGPALIAGKGAGGYLWYNWKATFTGIIYLTTRGSSFDTLLGVYTGSDLNNLTSVVEDDDSGGFFTSLVSFNCTNEVTYQIVVAGFEGATGNVALELSPGPAIGLPGPASGYVVGGSEPVITQQPASQIVQAGSTVTLGVGASSAANCQWYLDNAPVAGGTDTNLLIPNFSSNAVGTYFLQISNAYGMVQSAPATVEIAVQNQNGSPTNLAEDKFGDAVNLSAGITPEHRPEDSGGDTGGFTLSQAFSTIGATKDEGEPNHAGQPGGASYWYSYTEYRNGTLVFDTTNSTFNTILAIYVGPGNSFATLTNVGAAYTTNYMKYGQPSVQVSNKVTTTYYIAVDGYQGASGAARLNIRFNPIGAPSTTITTNSQTVIAITSPANNSFITNSSITVRGTVKGPPQQQMASFAQFVQLTVNTNTIQASINAPTYSTALVSGPGGTVEAIAQESVNWSATVSLVSGANVITAQSFTTNGQTNVSLPVTRTVFYAATRPSPLDKSVLTLLTNGNGKITGLANQASLEVNKVYTVKAVPVGNWVFTNWSSGTNTNSLTSLSDSASLSFLMSSNLILQASFVTNPFTALAGVYNGLFSPSNGVNEAESGFLTATLPASGRGSYSAKVMLDGGSYPFSGAFDLSLQAQKTVNRGGNPPLTVTLQLTNDQLTGSINDGLTNSVLQAYRTAAAPTYEGRYTLVIPPGDASNGPVGYGYATVNNNAKDHAVINGRLADSAAFSQSVAVATNGAIPLYASLYARKGSLQGWLTLTNNPSTILGSNLTWIKVSGTTSFTNTNLTVLGSLYTPPTADATELTNGTLTLSNSGAASALVYSNISIVGGKLINTNTSNPSNLLKGQLAPETGVLTLTFRPTGADSDTVARGVILPDQDTTNAAGWFLDSDQSGSFLIQQ